MCTVGTPGPPSSFNLTTNCIISLVFFILRLQRVSPCQVDMLISLLPIYGLNGIFDTVTRISDQCHYHEDSPVRSCWVLAPGPRLLPY